MRNALLCSRLSRLAGWCATAVSAVVALTADTAVAQAADPQPPKGFTALFNGKDLSGWHGMPTFDPRKLAAMPEEERKAQIEKWNDDIKKHWKVEKGELVNDGQGVYLTTDKDRSEEHTSELQSHVK